MNTAVLRAYALGKQGEFWSLDYSLRLAVGFERSRDIPADFLRAAFELGRAVYFEGRRAS